MIIEYDNDKINEILKDKDDADISNLKTVYTLQKSNMFKNCITLRDEYNNILDIWSVPLLNGVILYNENYMILAYQSNIVYKSGKVYKSRIFKIPNKEVVESFILDFVI